MRSFDLWFLGLLATCTLVGEGTAADFAAAAFAGQSPP